MSQQYAPVGQLDVSVDDEVAVEATTTQIIDDDDTDKEEEEEVAAEFDPLFEFTDDIQEKTVSKQIQPASNSNKLWQAVGSVNWIKILRFTATYLALPFITGVMAGMGEIFANEFMYRWGWRGARPVAVAGRNGRVFPVAAEKANDVSDSIYDIVD
ncbi:hypothetical protein GGI21_000890 [Coemansia aciculifera]|nr:hypothetical protein GGI21_000890 [Coemansia aciculifera]